MQSYYAGIPSRFKPVADSRAPLFTVYILIQKKLYQNAPSPDPTPTLPPLFQTSGPPLIQAYTTSQNLSIKTYSFHALYKNVLRCRTAEHLTHELHKQQLTSLVS